MTIQFDAAKKFRSSKKTSSRSDDLAGSGTTDTFESQSTADRTSFTRGFSRRTVVERLLLALLVGLLFFFAVLLGMVIFGFGVDATGLALAAKTWIANLAVFFLLILGVLAVFSGEKRQD